MDAVFFYTCLFKKWEEKKVKGYYTTGDSILNGLMAEYGDWNKKKKKEVSLPIYYDLNKVSLNSNPAEGIH